MSKTRYDWLVDGQPTQTRYTGLGYVTRSIEVSMEFKTTGATQESGTFPIAFIDVTTSRAFLRSVSGIYKDNLLTNVLCFVGQELCKFIERPVIQFAVKLCPTSFLHTDFRQIFKCKYCGGRVNNLLRDTMVYVSHKPSFSPRKFTEFPLAGTSAFRLQLLAKVSTLGSGVLHLLGIKKGVVGADSNVHNTPVNTENLLVSDQFRCPGFHLAMQVKDLALFIERQGRGLYLPADVLLVVIRDSERCFDTSVAGGDCSVTGIHTDTDYSLIVPHRRILFTERFELAFNRFQRLTGTISCTLYQRGREIRNRLSDILVGGIVAVHLVCGMGIKSPLRTSVERHCVISHGLQERFTPIRRNRKFQLNCPNHNHICDRIGIKVNGGEWCGAIPPMTKVMGFLAPRS